MNLKNFTLFLISCATLNAVDTAEKRQPIKRISIEEANKLWTKQSNAIQPVVNQQSKLVPKTI